MNKKIILIIILLTVIVLTAVIVKIETEEIEEKSNSNSITSGINLETKIDYEMDEMTGEYIIYNKETGIEIARVKDEADIRFYEENPDFDTGLNINDSDIRGEVIEVIDTIEPNE